MSQPTASFDPFVSMTFTEVNKPTCSQKIVNVSNVIKSALNLACKSGPFALLAAVFKFLAGSLALIFRLFIAPLHILVEARDKNGVITNFMVVDGRSFFSRTFGLNSGSRMNLVSMSDMKAPLLVTNNNWACDPCSCCSGIFCCVPTGCCTRLKQIELKTTRDNGGVVQASHPYKSCAIFANEIYVAHAGTAQECMIEFEDEEADPTWETQMNHNKILPCAEPNANPASNDFKMSKTRNGFSLKDFLMESTGDFLLDTVGDALEGGEDEEVGGEEDAVPPAEDAEEPPAEAEDCTIGGNADDVVTDPDLEAGEVAPEEAPVDAPNALEKGVANINSINENLAQLQEKGFQKILTSTSQWEVEFPVNSTHEQKCAIVLYVIQMYKGRL